ncbi:MAG: DUF5996 family protein [Candidatus Sericytochromatia bacterium]
MEKWPELPWAAWRETKDTLHMYTQIVGKIRLAKTAKMNQWWNAGLQVSARGLTTGLIPHGETGFELALDLVDHQLRMRTCDGEAREIPLGLPVNVFYREVIEGLAAMGLDAAIWPVPVEVMRPVPFTEDTRRTYDPAWANRIWRVMVLVEAVFTRHRAGFTGKSSPVQFFWGSFDLAVTRFSGRPALPRPEMEGFMCDAYNAELISLGFWPGGEWITGETYDRAMFYSYTYPKPDGLERAVVRPEAARWHPGLGEFVLWYDEVASAADPAAVLLAFAESTYEAGAHLAGWPVQAFALQPEPAPRVTMFPEAFGEVEAEG